MSKDPRATGGLTGAAAVKALRRLRSPVLKVQVTDEIIDASVPKHSGLCMISQAIKASVPWAKSIATDIQTIRITDPRIGVRYRYPTPSICQQALIMFDDGTPPRAFSFTLRTAHITTAYKRTKTEDGRVQMKPQHKLGRSRLVPRSNGLNDRTLPDTVGGRPVRARPGISFRREFGLRGYKGGYDLDRINEVRVPVGAPSISDKT